MALKIHGTHGGDACSGVLPAIKWDSTKEKKKVGIGAADARLPRHHQFSARTNLPSNPTPRSFSHLATLAPTYSSTPNVLETSVTISTEWTDFPEAAPGSKSSSVSYRSSNWLNSRKRGYPRGYYRNQHNAHSVADMRTGRSGDTTERWNRATGKQSPTHSWQKRINTRRTSHHNEITTPR